MIIGVVTCGAQEPCNTPCTSLTLPRISCADHAYSYSIKLAIHVRFGLQTFLFLIENIKMPGRSENENNRAWCHFQLTWNLNLLVACYLLWCHGKLSICNRLPRRGIREKLDCEIVLWWTKLYERQRVQFCQSKDNFTAQFFPNTTSGQRITC